jgi:uncharacterized repeat protein (TIGR03803 family)
MALGIAFLIAFATALPAVAQTETVLYNFCSLANCADGSLPTGGLVMDASGNLYGTTDEGGTYGEGTVFKLAPDGTEMVLHSFALTASDGGEPQAGLLIDTEGNLYGTTSSGGRAVIC